MGHAARARRGQLQVLVAVKLAVVLVFCILIIRTREAAASSTVDCSTQFNDLEPCFNYVQGSDPAPSTTCCTAFSNVQATSPVCLCALLQQFQDPSSGLGNVTRALDISTLCKVPTDVSRCASLLGAPAPAPAMAPVPSPVLATPPPAQQSPPPTDESPAPTGAEVDCSAAFNNLTPCLTYVTANGTQPPASDCCTALSGVQQSQPICLCQLLAQMNDSSQYGVNATKAMELPTICKVHADTSKCSALLQSPIASPAAPVGSPSIPFSAAPAPAASRPTVAPHVTAPSPATKTPAAPPPAAPTPSGLHTPAPSGPQSSSSSPPPEAGTAASGGHASPASAPAGSSPLSSTLKGGASRQFRSSISQQSAMLLLTVAVAAFFAS
ncbi:hypothetical protein BDL97_08G016100 [Sphagnum fallax]|nr:hypothetical protein BDL97_08G016100 [Sphagnum fallax]